MRSQKLLSLHSLSQAIASINDTAIDPTAWDTALTSIVSFSRGLSGSMWILEGQSLVSNIATVRSTSGGPGYGQYRALDPLFPVVVNTPPGRPVVGSSIEDRTTFLRSEFYNDFARPNDLIDCVMMRIDDGAGGAIVGIGRSHADGVFERVDAELLELFYPHLRQAFRVRKHILECQGLREAALEGLGRLRHGVLIADSEGQILFINLTGQRIVQLSDGLTISGRRLRASRAGEDRLLSAAMMDASHTGGRTIAIERPSGALPFILNVSAATSELFREHLRPRNRLPAAMVLISRPYDLHQPEVGAALQASFGLTLAESSVASAMSRIRNVKSAARELGCAPSTVRWHLRTVFQKTKTSSQVELVQVIERALDIV